MSFEATGTSAGRKRIAHCDVSTDPAQTRCVCLSGDFFDQYNTSTSKHADPCKRQRRALTVSFGSESLLLEFDESEEQQGSTSEERQSSLHHVVQELDTKTYDGPQQASRVGWICVSSFYLDVTGHLLKNFLDLLVQRGSTDLLLSVHAVLVGMLTKIKTKGRAGMCSPTVVLYPQNAEAVNFISNTVAAAVLSSLAMSSSKARR